MVWEWCPKLHQGRSRDGIRKHFFTKSVVCNRSAIGFLERWLMSQTCQYFRGVWTVPLVMGSSFWTVQMVIGGTFQIKYSILFCSIRFYWKVHIQENIESKGLQHPTTSSGELAWSCLGRCLSRPLESKQWWLLGMKMAPGAAKGSS